MPDSLVRRLKSLIFETLCLDDVRAENLHAFSFGTIDYMMLTRIAGRLTSHLEANYSATVGGPSGVADAPAK